MVLGIPGPLAFDTIGPGADVVEVFRGAPSHVLVPPTGGRGTGWLDGWMWCGCAGTAAPCSRADDALLT
jgi:hypothetical protein